MDEHLDSGPVVGDDSADGAVCIAIPNFGGVSLDALRPAPPFDPARAARIARDVAQALARLHATGALHGAVRPASVLMRLERATLLDAGVARTTGGAGDGLDAFAFTSPEQAGLLARPVDARSDLYALGCLLYWLLAGRPPFAARTVDALLHAHVARRPERPGAHAPRTPRALEAIVLKLLEKEPDDRYRSAAALAFDLDRLGALEAEISRQGAASLDAGAGAPLPGRALVDDASPRDAERKDSARDVHERRKLSSFLEIGKALHAAQDLDALLAVVLEAALEVTGAERGYLFLLEGEVGARRLTPRLSRLVNGGDESDRQALAEDARRLVPRALGLPEPVLREALDRSAPVVLAGESPGEGADLDGRAPRSPSDSGAVGALPPALLLSAKLGGHRSIVCVPLKGRERALGLLYLDNRLVRGLFGEREVDLVVAFAAQAGLAIENARTLEELSRKNRLLEESQAHLVRSAKLSAAGQLAAGVSHEIRNPLNIISGSIYVLKERLRGLDDPKVRDYLEHVEAEVKRAAAMTERLLDVARPSERDPAAVDANEVVRGSLPLIAASAGRRDVAVEAALAERLPRVMGDLSELRQVVVNLVLNAAQALEAHPPSSGAGRIVVRTRAHGSEVLIEVEDDGPGISVADKGRLFEPFFTRREGGTGLGLFVCWGIIERHGGRLEVESAPGRGAVFTVRLTALPE